MNGKTYVISSDCFIEDRNKIAEALSKSNTKITRLSFNRISIPDNLEDFEPETECLDTIEKNYLKDNNISAAAIIRMQKEQLKNIISQIQKSSAVYICEEHIPEYFFLKKFLFKKLFNFHSFGKIINNELISVNAGAIDIGIKLDTSLKTMEEKISCTETVFPEFNGLIAIDPPPDALPYSHLGYFRAPLNFARNLISFLDTQYKNERHPVVRIVVPQEHDPYKHSKRAFEIAKILGKRCEKVESFSDLKRNTSVITWSTQQFFKLLNSGLRPIPTTKCGASFLFRKSENIGELIINRHSATEIGYLLQYYRNNTIKP